MAEEANEAASFATITAMDRDWRAVNGGQLWESAQRGYAQHGRGAVIVVFGELASAEEIVVAYASRVEWLTASVATQVASYNPATELVVVCFGRLDDRRAQVRPRAYVYRYLTPSA
jgi:hypothetical protein